MSFARVRALVVVGLLAAVALVVVVVAVLKDSQGTAGTAAACPDGWPLVDLRLREQKDVKINVYNATDEAGRAGSVADDFRNRKFQVKKVGNEKKAFDGVAELWWDSLEAVIENGRRPEAQAAAAKLLEDERRFIDLPRSPLWWGEEQVIVG